MHASHDFKTARQVAHLAAKREADRRKRLLKGQCHKYTCAQVAGMFGCSLTTAKKYARDLGESLKPRKPGGGKNQWTEHRHAQWDSDDLPLVVREFASKPWGTYDPGLLAEYEEIAA